MSSANRHKYHTRLPIVHYSHDRLHMAHYFDVRVLIIEAVST